MRPVFCGNFDYDTRQYDLEGLFSNYGAIRPHRHEVRYPIPSLPCLSSLLPRCSNLIEVFRHLHKCLINNIKSARSESNPL